MPHESNTDAEKFSIPTYILNNKFEQALEIETKNIVPMPLSEQLFTIQTFYAFLYRKVLHGQQSLSDKKLSNSSERRQSKIRSQGFLIQYNPRVYNH